MLLSETWKSPEAVAIRQGNYVYVLNKLLTSASLNFSAATEDSLLKAFEVKEITSEEQLLCLGISALSLFIQLEWTGPAPHTDAAAFIGTLMSLRTTDDVIKNLVADSDDVTPTTCPHLLLIAKTVFTDARRKFPSSMWSQLWLLRATFIHQLVLEESSSQLYIQINELLETLGASITKDENQIHFHLEYARIYLYYGFVEKAHIAIEKAAAVADLKYNFTGVLGKRTRYQGHDLAQLVMNIEVGKNEIITSEEKLDCEPKILPLDDDVRLEKIKFADDVELKEVALTFQHVAIFLAVLMLRRKSLPEDELSIEESKTIVDNLLRNKCSWSVRLGSLLVRSHLERSARRTVERAMLQVQSVLDDVQGETPSAKDRLNDFFISYLPSKREVEATLAEFQLSLGAFKSALEICLRLKHWELAIVCYNALQLRHKAQELIEQELQKCETPKLWCLLGDATDDTSCYEKAWELSDHKSPRAQRHWGNYLYSRKKYGECIEHFEESLEINSLQSDLWFRLGFAALHEEKWELGAKAYRRYSTLEPDCFEAWNNLARCYCELKQTQRAWRALREALKVDTSNWRVWDNYMVVSAQEKQFSEVIRSYNELLNLKKENHVDMQALLTLVGGYFTCEEDSVRRQLKQPLLKLLERISSKPTEHAADVWILSADVHSLEDSEEERAKELECLMQAHTSAVNVNGWDTEIDRCKKVIGILERLSEFAAQKPNFKSMFLLIARPSVGTITRRYPDLDVCDNIQQILQRLVDS